MKQQESDFQERPNPDMKTSSGSKTKATTAGQFDVPVDKPAPNKAAAAEQDLKGKELDAERKLKADELLAERNLTKEELLALHQKTKSQLVAAQAKVKDLTEAVRYRDRKISKLGPGVAGGGVGKVVGSNVTDHSHLGEAEVPVEVHAQAKTEAKTVAKKPSAPKH